MLTRSCSHLPGDKYWVFKEVTAEPGYPHSLVELGSCLPKDGIDTALRWEPVGKTYFFKGDQYWRYNEEKRTADPGYPKPIAVWKGIPDSPQGAFISREGCECQTGILLSGFTDRGSLNKWPNLSLSALELLCLLFTAQILGVKCFLTLID